MGKSKACSKYPNSAACIRSGYNPGVSIANSKANGTHRTPKPPKPPKTAVPTKARRPGLPPRISWNGKDKGGKGGSRGKK